MKQELLTKSSISLTRIMQDYFLIKKIVSKLQLNIELIIFCLVKAEHGKLQSVNNNLESLCKGLQQQNQDLIEENKKLQNDEKELRTGLASDFQERINTITTQLQEQAKEHLIKSKENEMYNYYLYSRYLSLLVSEKS